MESVGTRSSERSGAEPRRAIIVDIEGPVGELPPIQQSDSSKKSAVDSTKSNKNTNMKKKSLSKQVREARANRFAGEMTGIKLIRHALCSLIGSQRASQWRTAFSILDEFIKSGKSSGAGGMTLPDCLQLLRSEPLLFAVNGDRISLASSDFNDAVYCDRLCELFQIPYFHLDKEKADGEFGELVAKGHLPPPLSTAQLEVEEPQRLLASRLQVVLLVSETSCRAFFTFQKTEACGSTQRIFYQDIEVSDWTLAADLDLGAGKAHRYTASFLYFLTSGAKLLPVRFKKMETLINEMNLRQRREEYEQFLLSLEQMALADGAQLKDLPPDVVGLDCEMVGVGPGQNRENLGRVSIVSGTGAVLYDTFVAPLEPVTDYRTRVSGIRPEDLAGAPSFQSVREAVADLLTNKLLVGHALHHDLDILELFHPLDRIRDTVVFFMFSGGQSRSLKYLSERFLKEAIQTGRHSSVEDALMPVRLYGMFRSVWESEPKYWGLAKDWQQGQKRSTAAAKEKAFHQYLSQLEAHVGKLSTDESAHQQHQDIVGLAVDTVSTGPDWSERVAGRVSLVDSQGSLLLERFVAPTKPITDHLTDITGIRPEDLATAPSLAAVQAEVVSLLAGRVVVGHGLHQHLRLLLRRNQSHPNHKLRDLEVLCSGGGVTPALSWLASHYLKKEEYEQGWSSSANNARASVLLYHKFRLFWEREPQLWGRKRAGQNGPRGGRFQHGGHGRGQYSGHSGRNADGGPEQSGQAGRGFRAQRGRGGLVRGARRGRGLRGYY